jgi:ribonuclease P protein component
MGLPKIHRLRHRHDFSRVYNEGLRRSTNWITLRALFHLPEHHLPASDSLSPPQPVATQIGIVVSLKVSKRAVVRNRIRRRIQAAMSCLLPRIAPGWKLVIIVRPNLTECNYGEILQQLEKLLIEAKVLHGNS